MALRWERRTAGAAKAEGADLETLALAVCNLDPYVRWALATEGRAFVVGGRSVPAAWQVPPDRYTVIVQARDRQHFNQIMRDKALALKTDQAIYGLAVPGTQSWARHFTAEICSSAVPRLLALTDDSWNWELAQAMRANDSPNAGSPGGRWGAREGVFTAPNLLARALEGGRPALHGGQYRAVNGGGTGRVAAASTRGVKRPGPGTIAVIDFGCPFLSRRYIRNPDDLNGRLTTRIRALWDQGASHLPPVGQDAASWPWQPPEGFSYGRELSNGDIDRMLASLAPTATCSAVDDGQAYRGLGYLVADTDPRSRVWFSTHGSHVLDVAAGSRDPVAGDAPDPLTNARDCASAADIMFVQLPTATSVDSSGSSLSARVLDAVRFVLDRTDPAAPLVVNISYGTHAGPHDGSSLIEQALDELLDLRKKNFAIVVAAGNARRDACHLRREVRRGKGAVMQAHLVAGDTTDTFIEFWYTPPDAASQSRLEARVRTPLGDWSDWCEPGTQIELQDQSSGDVVALLRHDLKVPNGRRAMLLLATAPTAQPEGVALVPAPAGEWDVELRWRHDPEAVAKASPPNASPLPDLPGEIMVDAWIERDDPGRADGPRSHFIGLDLNDDEHTLCSLATGAHTVVVGGCYRHDGREVSYSSIGPRDQANAVRMVWAACEDNDEERGILAGAVRNNEVFRMNGTSVAAPVVARRLYNLMVDRAVSRADMNQALDDLCEKYGDVIRRPA
ncbi:MAG: S8 family serine peptidase [Aquabacterium sp.]